MAKFDTRKIFIQFQSKHTKEIRDQHKNIREISEFKYPTKNLVNSKIAKSDKKNPREIYTFKVIIFIWIFLSNNKQDGADKIESGSGTPTIKQQDKDDNNGGWGDYPRPDNDNNDNSGDVGEENKQQQNPEDSGVAKEISANGLFYLLNDTETEFSLEYVLCLYFTGSVTASRFFF